MRAVYVIRPTHAYGTRETAAGRRLVLHVVFMSVSGWLTWTTDTKSDWNPNISAVCVDPRVMDTFSVAVDEYDVLRNLVYANCQQDSIVYRLKYVLHHGLLLCKYSSSTEETTPRHEHHWRSLP